MGGDPGTEGRPARHPLLVRAVTQGPAGELLPGNFPEYQLMP
ncbi:hypothetical protein ACFW1F_01235 [Streptomyces bungoensis]